MRRVAALGTAIALSLTLASSAVAGPRNSFNGDFDVLADGVILGHITAQIPADSSTVGTYLFVGTNGGHGTGVISEPAYYHHDWGNEVWFNAVEVGSPTAAFGVFTGHFVDVLDPAAEDYVEFWSTPLQQNGLGDWSVGSTWHNDPAWSVGAGAFVLKVRD